MILAEEQRDLVLAVDSVIDKVGSMTILELKTQKRLWEERICNDSIDSPLQKARLRALRSINKELESRR